MSEWWRDALVYEIYVRSFADASGDGSGDLAGITDRLAHVAELGADAIWLTPFYPSPQDDGGYDVADYRDVDPLYGDLAAFDALVDRAHALGLRVVVDIVPNHTSAAHSWFRAAVASAPGSPERARYWIRDGRGVNGSEPPNNWSSTFGGPAWTRLPDGQWYLHLFAPSQPDLDWRHPDVAADFERTLRFWLDRGVDGFRVDVAMGVVKDPRLRDVPDGVGPDLLAPLYVPTDMWNQPGVLDVWRSWRRVCASYDGDRVLIGEVWLGDAREVARYLDGSGLHLAFNFRLLRAGWSAVELRTEIDRSLSALAAVGAPSSWVLSNHDVVRHPTRFGPGDTGERRARAALLMLLALPGPVFLYAGEELGLPEALVPPDARRDPVWTRSGHREPGRDGCRVPLPWSGDAPPYAFGALPTWLPQPADWARHAVSAQRADPDSVLALYTAAIGLRRKLGLGRAPLRWVDGADGDVLTFTAGAVTCVLNAGSRDVPLPSGAVLLASDPRASDAVGGREAARRLPPDAAVWLG